MRVGNAGIRCAVGKCQTMPRTPGATLREDCEDVKASYFHIFVMLVNLRILLILQIKQLLDDTNKRAVAFWNKVNDMHIMATRNTG